MEVCKHHKPFKQLTTHHSFLKKKNKRKKKKKKVVSLASFVALQVWYGIPNERVPKSPLQ